MPAHLTSRRSLLLGAAGLATSSALAGCALPGSEASTAAKGKDGKVVLRYQGWANKVLGPELAEDLGYFDVVRLKWVGATISGPQDIQSVATNQTDVGGAFTGAVVNLIEAGSPITAVLNYYGSNARNYQGFYVRKDSPIRTPKDLVGKKIAVNTLGGHAEASVDTWLTEAGLGPKEITKVQLVVLPPNDTEQALRRGQVDVGILSDILQDHALAADDIRELVRDTSFLGHINGGQYVLRDDFIEAEPEATRDFTTGVAKAIEWTKTHSREQVIERYTKIVEARDRNESVEPLAHWKSSGVPSRGGEISDKDFTQWDGYLVRSKVVREGQLDPKSYYTNEYNDLAKEGSS